MTRRFEDDGGQLVTIDGTLAFRWAGDEPLVVGEKVWLPGNWTTMHEPWIGTVTALGTTYAGAVLSAIRRAHPV